MAQAIESLVVLPSGAVDDDTLLYETETWFVRRGLPYFIQDYKATDDVFTKALPLLIAYFIGNLMVVLSLHLTPVERIGGALLGMALLCFGTCLVDGGCCPYRSISGGLS
jgi:hypothetical protein